MTLNLLRFEGRMCYTIYPQPNEMSPRATNAGDVSHAEKGRD